MAGAFVRKHDVSLQILLGQRKTRQGVLPLV